MHNLSINDLTNTVSYPHHSELSSAAAPYWLALVSHPIQTVLAVCPVHIILVIGQDNAVLIVFHTVLVPCHNPTALSGHHDHAASVI